MKYKLSGLTCALSLLVASLTSLQPAIAENFSLESIHRDMHILSSDEMAGRASFTEQIDKAADYIAGRFSDMGLSPLPGMKSFKQDFSIFHIAPQSFSVSLNDSAISAEQIMVISGHERLQWTADSPVDVRYIGKSDDFRQKMREFNQHNQNLLIIVDPEHAGGFGRYRNHFNQGTTRFEKNQGLSAVVVVAPFESVTAFSVDMTSDIESKRLTNVVGYLPATLSSEESVLYSAHYDHIGIKPGLEGDKIFNGADDDASGTTAVMQLADYFRQKKERKRNLMFVAFTAEEIGGFGSQYFSKQLNPESIIAMINLEMIGKVSKFGQGKVWMTGFERSDLAKIMNKELQHGEIFADPYPQQRLFYRSDNATLARLGVPAHSFSSSQIDKDQHYHKPSDELATLDMLNMKMVIETIAQGSQSLVNGEATPARVDTSQVKSSGSFY